MALRREIKQFFAAVEATTLGSSSVSLRPGLRVGEVVGAALKHVDDAPQGPMPQILEVKAKRKKCHETPSPRTSKQRAGQSTTCAPAAGRPAP